MIIPSFTNPEEFKLLTQVSCLSTVLLIDSKIKAIQLELDHTINMKHKKAGISIEKHKDFLRGQIQDLTAAKAAINDILLT